MKQRIEIKSFNPYENLYPNRKLVNLEALILIKHLRNQGFEVVILPDNNQPVEYLFKKGLQEFLSDPLNIIYIGIPLSILTGILTNYIQKLLDRRKNTKNELKINIENLIIQNKETNKYYLGTGNEVQLEKLKNNQQKIKKNKEEFNEKLNAISPYQDYPFPIFLEHKPNIVGWCILWEDDQGLRSEGIITDKIVRRKINKGKLKGASVTGIAKKSLCSICSSNYVDCNHISGERYDGKKCSNVIYEIDFVETSLVKRPINENCILGLK